MTNFDAQNTHKKYGFQYNHESMDNVKEGDDLSKGTTRTCQTSCNVEYRISEDADAEPFPLFISESHANSLKSQVVREVEVELEDGTIEKRIVKEEVPLERGNKICGRYGDKSVIVPNDELSTIPHMTGKEIDAYIESNAGRKARIIDRLFKPWTVEEEPKFKGTIDEEFHFKLRKFLEENGVVVPNEENVRPLDMMTRDDANKLWDAYMMEMKKLSDVISQKYLSEPFSIKLDCSKLDPVDRDKLQELLSNKCRLNTEPPKEE